MPVLPPVWPPNNEIVCKPGVTKNGSHSTLEAVVLPVVLPRTVYRVSKLSEAVDMIC